jgi:hypothetical protein
MGKSEGKRCGRKAASAFHARRRARRAKLQLRQRLAEAWRATEGGGQIAANDDPHDRTSPFIRTASDFRQKS